MFIFFSVRTENIYDNCPVRQENVQTCSNAEERSESSESELPLSDIQFHQHNVWVPANPYLTERIPNWLYVYSRAPIELDPQLKWNLFSEEELHFYLAMINRLYKEEAQELVLGYEAFRVVLQKEIERRESDEGNIYNNVASAMSTESKANDEPSSEGRNWSADPSANFNIYNNVNNVFDGQAQGQAVGNRNTSKPDHHYSNIADLSQELTTVKSNV
jgi:hypothetical protein